MVLRSICLLFVGLPIIAGGIMPDTARAATIKAPKKVAAVFPPVASSESGRDLAMGIADYAAMDLQASGAFYHLHLKQVMSMLRQHQLSPDELMASGEPQRATRRLGAQAGVVSRLSKTGDGWQLAIWAFTAGDKTGREERRTEVTLPQDASRAVHQGARAIAEAVAALTGDRLPAVAPPPTQSSAAMAAYLTCYRVLARQPMGRRKSHVLKGAELAMARKACEAATRSDPSFHEAWAAASLAASLTLASEEAGAALRKAKSKRYIPMAVLARYWLVTRFSGNEPGRAVLEAAVKERPGSLIFQTYLGEHLNVTDHYEDARKVWQGYLEKVPSSPYALAQLGYALARLEKMGAALETTRKALAMDAASPELQLELASRLIDAGELKDAIAVLNALTASESASGEAILRLGYAYLLQGDLKAARREIERAIKSATGAEAWRTRGRGHFDLALIEARAKRWEEVERELLQAATEGFIAPKYTLNQYQEIQPALLRPNVKALYDGAPAPAVKPINLFATPFPVDTSGAINARGPRKKKYTGVRF